MWYATIIDFLCSPGTNSTCSWYIILFMYCCHTQLWSPILNQHTHTHTPHNYRCSRPRWVSRQQALALGLPTSDDLSSGPSPLCLLCIWLYFDPTISPFYHKHLFSVMLMMVSIGLSRKNIPVFFLYYSHRTPLTLLITKRVRFSPTPSNSLQHQLDVL